MKLLISLRNDIAVPVNLQIVGPQHPYGTIGVIEPTHHRFDSGNQFSGADRLGNVVIRPFVQPFYFGFLITPGREKDDWNVPQIGIAPHSLDRKSTRLNSSHVAISYA